MIIITQAHILTDVLIPAFLLVLQPEAVELANPVLRAIHHPYSQFAPASYHHGASAGMHFHYLDNILVVPSDHSVSAWQQDHRVVEPTDILADLGVEAIQAFHSVGGGIGGIVLCPQYQFTIH
ncbi:hypothetical protein DSECCO2_551210 [anaerobic digester metagenome]